MAANVRDYRTKFRLISRGRAARTHLEYTFTFQRTVAVYRTPPQCGLGNRQGNFRQRLAHQPAVRTCLEIVEFQQLDRLFRGRVGRYAYAGSQCRRNRRAGNIDSMHQGAWSHGLDLSVRSDAHTVSDAVWYPIADVWGRWFRKCRIK